jgi:hypothetical protein
VEGIATDPEKVKVIQEFPTPKNCKQLKSFLGLVNYYQRFTSKYADSTVPLVKLLSKVIKWSWKRDHDEALQQVKSLFIKTVILHHPRIGERFYLQTDASNIAIGAHLHQIDEKGQKAVLGFVSRTLKGAELTYFTSEKELLAIVHSLPEFRNNNLGVKLTIITDNKALVFLLKCKLLSARLTRWILAMQEYQL